MADELTRAAQDYLRVIHDLGGTERVVSPAEIAARLGVSPPSITAMFKRLADHRWVDYEPGRGVRLTGEGRSTSWRIVRRHRLIEVFLHRALGMDWSEVHAEAELLEHAVSPRLEQAIADHLGGPREDPFGHPITRPEGPPPARELSALCNCEPGQRLVIREVSEDSPERLRRWRSMGLLPGAFVRIVNRHELDDVFELLVGDRTLHLGSEALEGLRGELAAD